jgi:hypothetical protein
MELTKTLGVAAAAALALMAFSSSASATTLEVGGVRQTGAVTLKATLKTSTSLALSEPNGFTIRTCTVSALEGATTSFTGTTVTMPIKTMTLQSCSEEPNVIDTTGSLTFERIGTTTNATVRWAGFKLTWPSAFGAVTCAIGASPGADAGTLTGVASGQATLDIDVPVSCSPPYSSVRLTGTYIVTSPAGLGVTF